jgi:hypothetical protein
MRSLDDIQSSGFQTVLSDRCSLDETTFENMIEEVGNSRAGNRDARSTQTEVANGRPTLIQLATGDIHIPDESWTSLTEVTAVFPGGWKGSGVA